MVIGISLMLWEREREQSYEMDEKLMKELAAFIDLADGNEIEEKIRTVFGVQTPGWN